MPSVHNLKSAFQNLLRPIVRRLATIGITANAVTLFAFGLSLATGVWLALAPENRAVYFAYPLVLLLRMALNAIDGMLAREYHQKSKLGAFLNELGDVLSDTALFLPLAFVPGASQPLIAIFIALALTTEVTGLVAPSVGASRRYDGPMGKSDRALWLGAFMLLAGMWSPLRAYLNLLVILLTLLCLLTIANRVRCALREANRD